MCSGVNNAMGMYDIDVRERLGHKTLNAILVDVNTGHIGSKHMRDIAYKLGQRVGGSHLRRTDQGRLSNQAEMKNVLSDWYIEGMFEMSSSEALDRLIVILDSEEVRLRPLAKKLKDARDSEKTKVHLKVDSGDISNSKLDATLMEEIPPLHLPKTLSFGDTRKSLKHGVKSSNWETFKKRALEVIPRYFFHVLFRILAIRNGPS